MPLLKNDLSLTETSKGIIIMKTVSTQLKGQFPAIAWTSILAIASFLAPCAQAQYGYQSNDKGTPVLVSYIAVPGLPQPIPDSYESIGMRQARAHQAAARAALGSPGQVLAADYMIPKILSAPYADRYPLLVCRIRIKGCDVPIDDLQAKSVQFSGDTESEFRDAMMELKASKDQLESSISAAEVATPDSWTKAQSDAAGAYRRYAEAAARVERLSSS